jgi:N-acetylglutamate synthase-like GNAT family acetyltransferase
VFTRTFPIAAGPRVRLRLARPADYEHIACLLRQRDSSEFEFGLRRLLRFDPARRSVIAAFAPIDGADTLVGVGAIDHVPGAEVDTLVVDERLTDGLGELLAHALEARASSHTRRVA